MMKVGDSVRVILVTPAYTTMQGKLNQVGVIIRSADFGLDWIVEFSDHQQGAFFTNELEVVDEN